MSLNGNLRLTANLTNNKTGVDLSTPSESISVSVNKIMETGKVYHDTITLTSGTVTSLDVNDGSLSDVYGDAISLSAITSLYIKAQSTNTEDVIVSGGANAFLNDQPALGAGEGLGFLTDILVTSDSKIYIVGGDLTTTNVDIVVTGD